MLQISGGNFMKFKYFLGAAVTDVSTICVVDSKPRPCPGIRLTPATIVLTDRSKVISLAEDANGRVTASWVIVANAQLLLCRLSPQQETLQNFLSPAAARTKS